METVLVKKPSNGEGLELVDSECLYFESRTSECTAPTEYRCPYRRFKTVTEAPHGRHTPARGRTMSYSKPSRLTPTRK
jgi:hypothetical protein